jgi:uncharacterized protein YceH (UPF0502 family)
MVDELNPHEARVLGVLIEKAFTTPDVYPLSLHGATTACNQKSNRDPALYFTEPEVRVALQGLIAKHLAGGHTPAGSRVEKWRHNAREHLGLDDPDLAVLAELLLRGPQGSAALKTRATRMFTISSQEVIEQTLARLVEQGYARRLPPGAGSRIERWVQLLAPSLHLAGEEPPRPPRASSAEAPRPPMAAGPPAATSRPANLEARVVELENGLAEVQQQLAELTRQLGGP